MHSLAKKFMMARKLDFGENGNAELLDDQVFLMDASMFSKIAENTGKEGAYKIGESVGKSLASNIRKTGISGTKMIEFMMDLLTMMGLGDFELHDFDIKEKKGEVRVKNSLPSRKSEEKENAGCQIIAGIVSGIFSQNYEKEFKVTEKGCILEGDDLCRFKIQS
ncbi:MAG: methanogen output domain 1-containing protein [Candidatus Nanohaloarchaeota archaeon QJJ-9]|nr:methanogen output domain 1-containing protein [Candidatus Nanohaloarchaeota archaeon QJJ-9]